ncbi:MAG: hypothetical protein V4703_12800 [Actinomycetota bacterium]
MTLAALLNRECTLIQRIASGSTDRFGNPLRTDTPITTVCELQQTRRDEPSAAGELSITTWAVFLPAGTDINTGDVLIVEGREYEIVGDPWEARNPRTGLMSHVEATCKRARGADDEEGS